MRGGLRDCANIIYFYGITYCYGEKIHETNSIDCLSKLRAISVQLRGNIRFRGNISGIAQVLSTVEISFAD